jgi:ribosomal protein S18 acetylase RimI-like enzyme
MSATTSSRLGHVCIEGMRRSTTGRPLTNTSVRSGDGIHDEGLVEALVAAPVDEAGNESGEIQGLAHLREWVRPLRGVKCGYLDDLFVDPEHRGSGIVDALYDAMRAIAAERGWPVIRWTTADDNYRARAVYDRLATRTLWITYDMATE